MIRCGKSRRGALDVQGRIETESRRDGVRPLADYVAFAINEFNTERRIDRRLARVGRRAGDVVEREARKELIFCRNPVIKAQRELVGIGIHF